MSSLSRLLSVVLVAFAVLGIANSSENVNNEANKNITITVTKNYNHYIDNNDKKELIEDPVEELANNKLLEYTGCCIGAQDVYTKQNKTVFNEDIH